MAKAKVKKYEIEYKNGVKVIHWDGVFQPGDMSLCNSDLMGDSAEGVNGWKQGVVTNKKVSCPHCLRIIEHVKNITHDTER